MIFISKQLSTRLAPDHGEAVTSLQGGIEVTCVPGRSLCYRASAEGPRAPNITERHLTKLTFGLYLIRKPECKPQAS